MTINKGYLFAKKASEKSDFYRNHTGAVAIYNGSVIAEGWNSEKTSPLQARYNDLRGFDSYKYRASLHAEMMVISKIRYLDIDFSKVQLFVWRGKEQPRLSKPCEACEKAIREVGIKKVFYTGNDSYIKEIYQ